MIPPFAARETVYDARPELSSPGRFLRAAWMDIRASPAVGYGLFRSNLKARYRRSRLGYLWLILPAVMTTLACLYLQSQRILGLTDTRVPYAVFVLSGTVLWQVFVDALNVPLQQFAAARQLITRSRVPHEALVLAGMMEVFLNGALRLAVVAPVLVAYGVGASWAILLVPLGVAALALAGAAFGLLLAPLGLLYDDVGRAILLGTGFWFFLTPVVYRTPEGGLIGLNPVTPLLDTGRAWLTGGAAASGFLPVVLGSLLLSVAAWFLYRIARPHIVARLG
jgi:lipopolysaccharide transport system permease protein